MPVQTMYVHVYALVRCLSTGYTTVRETGSQGGVIMMIMSKYAFENDVGDKL